MSLEAYYMKMCFKLCLKKAVCELKNMNILLGDVRHQSPTINLWNKL